MSSPGRMRTGRPATDDLNSSMRTDTETTMVPVIVGYSDSARDLRLRLRFDDRELVVDERPSSITIGRAEENDVVVKGHLSSRLHARIVIGRSNFVLIDQSTNGTFVQTGDGEELFIRHDIRQLKGQGMIGLGCPPERGSQHTIHFTCEEIY
jgi:adenylate cyclase